MRLIVATKNKSKFKEIKKILEKTKHALLSLNDLRKKFIIVENGNTFYKNALKKAVSVSRFYKNDYVLGEDSGLEVDYLNGEPGIYSKRYSGKTSTSHKNNLKILEKLKGASFKERSAQFRCSLVLARGGKLIKSFDEKMLGFISMEEQGENGFGYDPIFYLPAYKKTLGQLPLSLKNRISHRAKAFKKLAIFLKLL